VPRLATPPLAPGALVRIVEWLAGQLGPLRVRLTGGEPLLRAELPEIVRNLCRLERVRELALTTNGSRLASLAAPLAAAGLDRVNVSLDAVDAERFAAVTGGGDVARTLAGIDAARAAGLEPVKLNTVLRRSTWRQDVPELLGFAAARGLEVRFIELMPSAGPGGADERIEAGEVRRWLAGRTVVSERPRDGRPARRGHVLWDGVEVRVGWITPVTEPFCGSCRRLRLDAAGSLRRCLMDDRALPLADLLVAEADQAVAARLAGYLAGKRRPGEMTAPAAMSRIGG
jgi:cyclic pyranopterin phosphate synthase